MAKEAPILINYEDSIIKTYHSDITKCYEKLAKNNRHKRRKSHRFAKKLLDQYKGVDPTTMNEGLTLTLRDATITVVVYEFIENGSKIKILINEQQEPIGDLSPPSPAV